MSKRYRTNIDYIDCVGRMIRTAGRRVGEGDVSDLPALVGLADELRAAIGVAVAGLRSAGVHWESIGAETGTTKQAAIKKWSDAANAINGAVTVSGSALEQR